MRQLLAALIILLFPGHLAEPRPIVGVDFLAGMSKHFPTRQALRMFRRVEVIHITILWELFGQDKTFLRELMKQPAREVIIEINPTCGPCRHTAGYEAQPPPGDFRTLRSIANFMETHTDGKVRFLWTTELERIYSSEEAAVTLRRMRALSPAPTIDCATLGRLPLLSADLVELHGAEARCPAGLRGWHIADSDGAELHGGALTAWLEGNSECQFVRVWNAAAQGFFNHRAPAPRERHPVVSRSFIAEVRPILRRMNHG